MQTKFLRPEKISLTRIQIILFVYEYGEGNLLAFLIIWAGDC